jgi:hypothetical protein
MTQKKEKEKKKKKSEVEIKFCFYSSYCNHTTLITKPSALIL